jgi:hypothetical protein
MNKCTNDDTEPGDCSGCGDANSGNSCCKNHSILYPLENCLKGCIQVGGNFRDCEWSTQSFEGFEGGGGCGVPKGDKYHNKHHHKKPNNFYEKLIELNHYIENK